MSLLTIVILPFLDNSHSIKFVNRLLWKELTLLNLINSKSIVTQVLVLVSATLFSQSIVIGIDNTFHKYCQRPC